MSNYMTARLTDGSTMELSHIATLQIPGLRKKSRQIHIFQAMKTSPLISLVVLFHDGCTITLYKKEILVQNYGQQIIKFTRENQAGMWGVPMETQQSKVGGNNILSHTTKPELSQYIHAAFLALQQQSCSRQLNKVSWKVFQASQRASLISIWKS